MMYSLPSSSTALSCLRSPIEVGFTESLIFSCQPGEVPEEGGELEEGDDGEKTKGCHHPQVPVNSHRSARDTTGA